MATRRNILGGAAASAGLALMAGPRRAVAATPPPRLLAAGVAGGRPCGLVWSQAGLERLDLPGRGHAVVRLAQDRALIVGRRPGVFCAMVDLPRSQVRNLLQPSERARFSGHGAVTPDGRLLVTSELDAESVAVRLGVRDARSGELRAVWVPDEIEPHDLGFARGGERLVVAVGGLVRDGGVAGPAVDPKGVRSAVLEIDPRTGRVLARHALGPDMVSLSLRHLGFAPDGRRVVVGMQDQDLSARRPLMGLLTIGEGIALLPMPAPEEIDFRGYVGSVAVDRAGRFAMASSPRGGVAGLWSLADGRWIGGVKVQDCCGLAAGEGTGVFWLTSGFGEVLRLQASDSGLRVAARNRVEAGFDNHLLRL